MFVRPLLLVGLVACLSGCGRSTNSPYPNRPIKVIVPFAPGGGSDKFARVFQKAIRQNPDLLPVSFVIQNVKGGGATIGSRRAKDSKPDGYTILLLHEAIVTAKYAGKVEYGPEAFEPIAATGKLGLVIAVADHSPYKSLAPLVAEIERQPNQVVWACNFDTPSHFVGKMLERHTKDGRFRFANIGDGSERFASLKGGHATVSAFSMAEYLSFRPAGLRAIAYCGPERHPADTSLLTSHEQGYPVTSINMQFWWAPKGTPANRVKYFAELLRKAMATEQVQSYITENHMEPVFVVGGQMQREVHMRAEAIAEVAGDVRPALPNFPAFIVVAVVALGLGVGVQAVRHRSSHRLEEKSVTDSAKHPLVAAGVVCTAWIYLLLLSWTELDFRILTAAFVLATGALLALNGHANADEGDTSGKGTGKTRTGGATTWTGLLVLALVVPLLLHFVFVNIFGMQLP